MLERLGPLASGVMPMLIGLIIPLAGLLLALGALAEKRYEDARRIGAATLVGAVVWSLAIF